MKPLTNDDARDLAIICTDALVDRGYVRDCMDTDSEEEFDVQDAIHETLATLFGAEDQDER